MRKTDTPAADTLYLSETFVNATKGHRFSETTPYEAWTNDPGKLFRTLQREYGRCISAVRQDPHEERIGWVFLKRMTYEDCRETYLREVWVTLHRRVVRPIETPVYEPLRMGR